MQLQKQYEAGVLDTVCLVFAYQWKRVKASPESLAKNADSLNRNSYNKSIANAIWLVRTCANHLLKRAESQGAWHPPF